jgi:two-component system, OmpR family, copper resistance phosphate regulon response regulator CusR
MRAQLLLIEDDERLSSVIKKSLQDEGFEVFAAFDAEMGFRLCESQPFDCVITDLVLPRGSGFDLCKKIRASGSTVPIIMLTALGKTDEKLEGFDAGADDYLVKPFDLRELVARIKSLLKRSNFEKNAPSTALTYADLSMDLRKKKAFRKGQELALTPKEYNLLEYFLRNPERVISREEIAKEVWNLNFDTGTNIIDVYINYLRKKVDKPFDFPLIHTRPGMGFIILQS